MLIVPSDPVDLGSCCWVAADVYLTSDNAFLGASFTDMASEPAEVYISTSPVSLLKYLPDTNESPNPPLVMASE